MRYDRVWTLCAIALLSACDRDHGAPTSSGHPSSRPPAATSSRAELEAAFRIAYGKPSQVVAQTPQGAMNFKPGGLVDVDHAAGVVALVALGENQENCHACTGGLSVHYLKRTASGFEPWGAVNGYGFDGDGFGAPPSWSIRRDLADYPVLVIETGYTGQGCTSAQQALVELTPEGAEVRAASIPVLYDNSGAYEEGDPQVVELEGEIRPLVKGKRFEVVFHGSRSLRLVYEREHGAYVTKDQKPDTC